MTLASFPVQTDQRIASFDDGRQARIFRIQENARKTPIFAEKIFYFQLPEKRAEEISCAPITDKRKRVKLLCARPQNVIVKS
jgi:hypothetical protein